MLNAAHCPATLCAVEFAVAALGSRFLQGGTGGVAPLGIITFDGTIDGDRAETAATAAGATAQSSPLFALKLARAFAQQR